MKTARFLAQKAREYADALKKLDEEFEDYCVNVEFIAKKAKYLFKTYLPDMSLRITKSELTWARVELIARDVEAELELAAEVMDLKAHLAES